MDISILTDNPNSWILPYVEILKKDLNQLTSHNITHVFDSKDLPGGDIMLILSCEKILPKNYLDAYKNSIVVHPSKVPHGKGWSPLAWQILEGLNKIPLSLFEADEKVDSGNIYLVDYICLNGNELNEEIKHKQGELTIKMVKEYIDRYPNIKGTLQKGKETFYPKRTKKDNKLNPNKTIKEQFNLLRIIDNERYPAFFNLDGNEYIIKIYKK
tara:strand:- start:466 stop:1104 length:639 start_codon:yes stop_codon:yes gene_type:complete